jgi:hypothetical protein
MTTTFFKILAPPPPPPPLRPRSLLGALSALTNSKTFFLLQDIGVLVKSCIAGVGVLILLNGAKATCRSEEELGIPARTVTALCLPTGSGSGATAAFSSLLALHCLAFFVAMVTKNSRWPRRGRVLISGAVTAIAAATAVGMILAVAWAAVAPAGLSYTCPDDLQGGLSPAGASAVVPGLCTDKQFSINENATATFDPSGCRCPGCSCQFSCSALCSASVNYEAQILVLTFTLSALYAAYLSFEYRNDVVFAGSVTHVRGIYRSRGALAEQIAQISALLRVYSGDQDDDGAAAASGSVAGVSGAGAGEGSVAAVSEIQAIGEAIEAEDEALRGDRSRLLDPETAGALDEQEALLLLQPSPGAEDPRVEADIAQIVTLLKEQRRAARRLLGRRRLFYKVLQDVSSLIKYMISYISLAFSLLALTGTCGEVLGDKGALRMSSRAVASACGPQNMVSYAFFCFLLASSASTFLFLFLTVIEKTLWFVRFSKIVLTASALAILTIASVQVSTVIAIFATPPYFECDRPSSPISAISWSTLCSSKTFLVPESQQGPSLIARCAEYCPTQADGVSSLLLVNIVISSFYFIFVGVSFNTRAQAFKQA